MMLIVDAWSFSFVVCPTTRTMTSALVLQFVVESSFLDIDSIKEKILPLSREFQVIGSEALEEHATCDVQTTIEGYQFGFQVSLLFALREAAHG